LSTSSQPASQAPLLLLYNFVFRFTILQAGRSVKDAGEDFDFSGFFFGTISGILIRKRAEKGDRI